MSTVSNTFNTSHYSYIRFSYVSHHRLMVAITANWSLKYHVDRHLNPETYNDELIDFIKGKSLYYL